MNMAVVYTGIVEQPMKNITFSADEDGRKFTRDEMY